MGTIGLIYMYLNDNKLVTIDNINILNDNDNDDDINETKIIKGGNYKINKTFFNKFYI